VPFCYQTLSIMNSTTYSTSATPSTEIDVFSLKAGATRSAGIYAIRGQGRGAGLTALTGISLNVKHWTTASTAGTALTPSPSDILGPAATAVPRIGTGGGVNAVTPGTGGPLYRGGIGFGGSGPGGWVAANPDAALVQSAAYAGSFDLYSVSGTASMLYDFGIEHQE